MFTLFAEIPDDSIVVSSWLHFKPGGLSNAAFDSVPGAFVPPQTIQWTLNDNTAGSTGLEYFIEYGNEVDRFTLPVNAPDSVYFLSKYLADNAVEIELLKMTWLMLGAPYDLEDKTVDGVFFDDFGPLDPDQWVIYELTNGEYNEISSASDSMFISGRSVWVKSRESALIDFGNGITHRTDVPFYISLDEGWNMIANPLYKTIFIAGVSVSDPVLVDTVLWAWNGAEYAELSQPVDSLPAGEGAFIYVYPGADSAWIALDANVSPPFSQNSVPSTSVAFNILVDMHADGKHDWAEIVLNAGGGEQLLGAPPSTPGGNRVYLLVPERVREYKRTILPWNDEGYELTVVVEGADNNIKNLEFTRGEGFLDECTFAVVNPRTNCVIYEANPGNYISLQTTGEEASFILIVGTETFIEQQTNQYDQLPSSFELKAPYPNPFNDKTILRYTLPRTTSVHLAIFDLLGRRVRILLSGEVQEAGFHQTEWDGRDIFGRTVASGLYFIWFRSDNIQTTRKLILLR